MSVQRRFAPRGVIFAGLLFDLTLARKIRQF